MKPSTPGPPPAWRKLPVRLLPSSSSNPSSSLQPPMGLWPLTPSPPLVSLTASTSPPSPAVPPCSDLYSHSTRKPPSRETISRDKQSFPEATLKKCPFKIAVLRATNYFSQLDVSFTCLKKGI